METASLIWTKVSWYGDHHFVPSNDDIVHIYTEDCICGPTPEYHHGQVGPTYRHHGLRSDA
jgi:hypothetical protein